MELGLWLETLNVHGGYGVRLRCCFTAGLESSSSAFRVPCSVCSERRALFKRFAVTPGYARSENTMPPTEWTCILSRGKSAAWCVFDIYN